MKVKNINGADLPYCKCGGWLEHWRKYSGQADPGYCPVEHCMNPARYAALVQKGGAAGNEWFVVMMCKEHAGKQGGTLIIADSAKLVTTNPKRTCGE